MGAVVTPVTSEMLSVCLVVALLCSSSLAGPLPREEDRQGDLIIGLLTSLIQDQINNALGITTTRGTPVIDLVGGLLGGTTTTSPAAADGILQLLLSILFPDASTTTTTAAPTTTSCGGLLGGGLLCP